MKFEAIKRVNKNNKAFKERLGAKQYEKQKRMKQKRKNVENHDN